VPGVRSSGITGQDATTTVVVGAILVGVATVSGAKIEAHTIAATIYIT
jgi:hypothetical protein